MHLLNVSEVEQKHFLQDGVKSEQNIYAEDGLEMSAAQNEYEPNYNILHTN
jgi:hypothetical protein